MSGEEKVSPALQQFVQEQQQKAQVTELTSNITSVCWDKCIGTPGRSLSSREQACLSECARRFLDTTQFMVQRFAQKSGGAGGAGGGGRF